MSFARIDRNEEGVIGYEEHAADIEAGFVKINADENLTSPVREYAAWLGKEAPGFPQSVAVSVTRCFDKIVDVNGDGSHVRPEFAGRILPVDDAVARRCAHLRIPDRRNEADALIAATGLASFIGVSIPAA
ncbi:hypothetical protein [Ensifer sesbaniae]|jgi:hypothetical protein|uniref:hypothetical protein n=1 Tax=Ensifer sesbaniae TaxID=1214071 RepID=UPI001FE941C6|nr:hypothetical protein [Ensifer sesbaniae]NRQ17457.1 hypothetical protein [Ensifer sesbaniae]